MKPCVDCDVNPRAPGKTRCVDCLDTAVRFDRERQVQLDWCDRERRRKRVALEDCETCAYRNGDRCAYYPPREGEQPLIPGRCNLWLPVADADPKPDEEEEEEEEEGGEFEEFPERTDDDRSYDLSIEGAAARATDHGDDDYEEYDGHRPGRLKRRD